jgi:DNA-binding beta-propeller fold protein YncE
VSNDGGGFSAFSYDQYGDVKPIRTLEVPHQSWGISLDLVNDEMAITSQQYQGISIYRRDASGTDRPLRTIRGANTKLADPHGVFIDASRDEVFTANHGNWTELRSYSDDAVMLPGQYVPGRFEAPSIRVHKASMDGNQPPMRTIQGPNTKLEWPMGIAVDLQRKEVVVANYGSNSILFYGQTTDGDVAPLRALGGDKTGIVGPIGVVVDSKKNELWVANYGEHSAVVFDTSASGNVAPKRIVRNAPAGTPTTGFTNASACAYDSKREQVLVPN